MRPTACAETLATTPNPMVRASHVLPYEPRRRRTRPETATKSDPTTCSSALANGAFIVLGGAIVVLSALLSRWLANLVPPNNRLTADQRAQMAVTPKVARPLVAIGAVGIVIGLVVIIAEILR